MASKPFPQAVAACLLTGLSLAASIPVHSATLLPQLYVRNGPACLKDSELVAANPTYDEAALEDLAKDPMRILKPWYLNMPKHWSIGYAPCLGLAQEPGGAALRLFRLDDFPGIYSSIPMAPDDPILDKQRVALQEWIAKGETAHGLPLRSRLYVEDSIELGLLQRQISFAGGQGRRVVLSYAIEPSLVTRISYEFQGLSDDGEAYLHFAVPLSLEGLAERDDESHLGYAAMEIYENPQTYARYLAAVESLIAEQQTRLQPSLDQLDRLVSRIKLVDQSD